MLFLVTYRWRDGEQEMIGSDSCTFNVITRNGLTLFRSLVNFGEPSGHCQDCGVKHGGIHHFGCDAERCPYCGLQLISCGCLEGASVNIISIKASQAMKGGKSA